MSNLAKLEKPLKDIFAEHGLFAHIKHERIENGDDVYKVYIADKDMYHLGICSLYTAEVKRNGSMLSPATIDVLDEDRRGDIENAVKEAFDFLCSCAITDLDLIRFFLGMQSALFYGQIAHLHDNQITKRIV